MKVVTAKDKKAKKSVLSTPLPSRHTRTASHPKSRLGPFFFRKYGATPSTGYERLLYDCMAGDATLFQRADMVEAGWSAVEPILDVWRALPPRGFPNYAAGAWGPSEADLLLARDGRQWRGAD